MADPNVIANAFGDELYDSLAPLAYGDVDNDYALKTYVYALAQMFNEVESFARTDDDGNPPYSLLFDLDRAQGNLIRYLAQFAGQTIPVGVDDAAARELVRKPSNAERGTFAAITKAITSRLTGTKYVRIIERDTSPYHFSVFTRSAEQPASDLSFTNLITNPSFETNQTGWVGTVTNRINAGSATGVATNTAAFGTSSLVCDTTNSADRQGVDYGSLAVTSGVKYLVSAYVKGNVGGESLALAVGDGTVGNFAKNFTATTSWQRVTLTYTPTGTGTTGVAVRTNGAANARFFVDGVQVLAAYVDPGYFDGSANGGVWTGTAHASTSTLAPTTPNGTVNAIKAVKPAGLIFTYNVTPGTTIDELVGTVDSLSGTIDNL